MAKTKEELNIIREEIGSLVLKLKELSQDELQEVTGGTDSSFIIKDNNGIFNFHVYTNDVNPEEKFNK